MKISVAMATYNGEKYIKEQLETILTQTVPVDEIIVSDDGSSDATLSIVQSLNNPRIKIITGNPNPGYCGNFEYALKHTTGDIIFLADQDDIWLPEKVEQNLRIFQDYPDIELVMTNGTLIDKDGNHLDGIFSCQIPETQSMKLQQKDYFGKSVYVCLANGMCMAMKKSLLNAILPFPDSKTCHDRWIAFCAMKNDSAFYLNLPLVKYRLHDTNASKSVKLSLKKRIKRLMNVSYNTPYDMYNMACAMLDKLNSTTPSHADAISMAQKMRNDHWRQIEMLSKGCIAGSISWIKLYRTDPAFRFNGSKYCIGQLLLVTLGRKYKKHPRTKVTTTTNSNLR